MDNLIIDYNHIILLINQIKYSNNMNNSLKLLRKKYKRITRNYNTKIPIDIIKKKFNSNMYENIKL